MASDLNKAYFIKMQVLNPRHDRHDFIALLEIPTTVDHWNMITYRTETNTSLTSSLARLAGSHVSHGSREIECGRVVGRDANFDRARPLVNQTINSYLNKLRMLLSKVWLWLEIVVQAPAGRAKAAQLLIHSIPNLNRFIAAQTTCPWLAD